MCQRRRESAVEWAWENAGRIGGLRDQKKGGNRFAIAAVK